MYVLLPMTSRQDTARFRHMRQCMQVIDCYGQRYGNYFAPELMVHIRRHGDPFRSAQSARRIMPSGCTFNDYLYAREQLFRNEPCIFDLTNDFDYDVPSIQLSDDDEN